MHRSSLVEIQLVLERDGITFMNEIGKEKEMEKLFGLLLMVVRYPEQSQTNNPFGKMIFKEISLLIIFTEQLHCFTVNWSSNSSQPVFFRWTMDSNYLLY